MTIGAITTAIGVIGTKRTSSGIRPTVIIGSTTTAPLGLRTVSTAHSAENSNVPLIEPLANKFRSLCQTTKSTSHPDVDGLRNHSDRSATKVTSLVRQSGFV